MKEILKVVKVVTHKQPHFDELFAYWQAKTLGYEEAFPGISKAPIELWDSVDDKKSPEDYEREGILLIGLGYGRFDDKIKGGGRKEGKCAAILMAEALGVTKMEGMFNLLKFALSADTQPKIGFLDPASVVKMINNNHPNDPQPAINFVFNLLDEYMVEQKRFFSTEGEFQRNATQEGVRTVDGKHIMLVTIESSNPAMTAYARSSEGGKAGVFVKIDPKEGTQIHFDPRLNLGKIAEDLIRALRVEEDNLKSRDWKVLGRAGELDPEDRWYGVAREGDRPEITLIANGTKTHARPKTSIPAEQIIEIVRMCVTEGYDPDRAIQCQAGRCTSTNGNPCPWYNYGMRRCRTVRYNEQQLQDNNQRQGARA